MNTTEIARQNGQALPAEVTYEPSPIESFEMLDVYAGGVASEAPRVDAIATISAGKKVTNAEGKTHPKASEHGEIVLHDEAGRAPALKAALEATGGKRLTITFPFDDPRRFIHQHFAWRTATQLKAFGDDKSLKVLGESGWAEYQAGTEGYKRTVANCKVEVYAYFTLAEWNEDGPAVVLDDGAGCYRLRFTSRHSLRSIVSQLKFVASLTKGLLAGIPFDLSIDYRQVADRTGTNRRIPVWVIVMKPPGGIRLTSKNFADLVQRALAQGSALMLPAPGAMTAEMAALEGDSVDLDELDIPQPSVQELETVERGGPADRDHYIRQWHAVASGSFLDDDNARGEFIYRHSERKTKSLATFLAAATEAEAAALIAALHAELHPDGDPETDTSNPTEQALKELRRIVHHFPDEMATPIMLGPAKSLQRELGGRMQLADEDQEALLFAAFERRRIEDLTQAEGRALRVWIGELEDDLGTVAAILEAMAEPSAADPAPAAPTEPPQGGEWDSLVEEHDSEQHTADDAPEQPEPSVESEARAAIAQLRELAEQVEGGEQILSTAQIKRLRGIVDRLDVHGADQDAFLTLAFGLEMHQLKVLHGTALSTWVTRPNAGAQAQAILAMAPKQATLV